MFPVSCLVVLKTNLVLSNTKQVICVLVQTKFNYIINSYGFCVGFLEISEDLYKVLLKNPKAHLLVPCKECGEQVSSLQEMRQTLDQVRISLDETRSEVKSSQFLTSSQLD